MYLDFFISFHFENFTAAISKVDNSINQGIGIYDYVFLFYIAFDPVVCNTSRRIDTISNNKNLVTVVISIYE